jgi:hypothetical protein
MSQSEDQISVLLKKLQDNGAKVRVGTKEGPEISKTVLDDLKAGNVQDVNAWVSWSKSF